MSGSLPRTTLPPSRLPLGTPVTIRLTQWARPDGFGSVDLEPEVVRETPRGVMLRLPTGTCIEVGRPGLSHVLVDGVTYRTWVMKQETPT